MGLPDSTKWATKLMRAGYKDMDELKDADISFDAIADEVGMPSGVKKKFVAGMNAFKESGIIPQELPQGDLNASAPTQTKASFNWPMFLGVTAVCCAVGGAAGLALRAASMAGAGAAGQHAD